MESNNRTIVKNTLFLYFRMMFMMGVSLFTSRIILQNLGVDDYGIYQAVGGIVGFLSFVNSALSSGSSRFITYALGEGNAEKLGKTFSTTLNVHILIALLVVVVAETAGLWFLYNKMIIAPGRMEAAVYTYHLSIVTALFSLTQVPYTASIIAHERMSVYAYTSIADVVARLLACYLLAIGGYDRLKLYATLILIVQVGSMLYYRYYCSRNFAEARFSLTFDRKIFKEIAAFSGWSMFAGSSIALNSQGILILLNMFFSPAVVAARAISLQVNMAANQFVNNFRQAANPQIVKKYASGDFKGSKRLLLESTRYSYYLMLMVSLPVCILAQPLLELWLGVVPEYAVPFLQIVIVQSLFQVFDTSFYTALYAKGQLKQNALVSPTLGFISFPITYIFFKLGCSPLALSWTSFVLYAVLGVFVKPMLIIRIVDYTWYDIWRVFRPCLKVSIVSAPLPILLAYCMDSSVFCNFLLIVITSILSVGIAVYTIGIDSITRNKVTAFVFKRIRGSLTPPF